MIENEKKLEDTPKEIEECIKEREEYLEGWKRAKADLINYKKDNTERMERAIQYREEVMISEIIDIIDDFRAAEREIPAEEKENDLIKGFLMIKIRLDDFIKKMEVEEIDSVGNHFDPNFHEAVEMIEGPEESGTVSEEISKGYKRKNRVIRPAKVRVIK